jgi:hypothetical protein
MYYLRGEDKFREKIHKSERLLEKEWCVDIDWYTWNITPEIVWWILRYPQKWDIYGSKSLSKYLLNNKIPVFWRTSIPVVEKQGKVVLQNTGILLFNKYLLRDLDP